MNAGDLDALLGLYEPTATFTVEPGKIVSGTAAIRDALTGFLAMKPSISLTPKVIGNAGDIALVSSSRELEGTGPEGPVPDLSIPGRPASAQARLPSSGTLRGRSSRPTSSISGPIAGAGATPSPRTAIAL